MEYVESENLAERVDRLGPLPPDEAAGLIRQAAIALAAAHAAGIVHRDVKPSNLLVTPAGTVKLSDFGIARLESDTVLTQTGLVVGSPAFLAPEVAGGAPATPASDMWSLGATVFHAVEGHPPFPSDGNVMGTDVPDRARGAAPSRSRRMAGAAGRAPDAPGPGCAAGTRPVCGRSSRRVPTRRQPRARCRPWRRLRRPGARPAGARARLPRRPPAGHPRAAVDDRGAPPYLADRRRRGDWPSPWSRWQRCCSRGATGSRGHRLRRPTSSKSPSSPSSRRRARRTRRARPRASP